MYRFMATRKREGGTDFEKKKKESRGEKKILRLSRLKEERSQKKNLMKGTDRRQLGLGV